MGQVSRSSFRITRRQAVARIGALPALLALGACGFALRGTAQLPFSQIYISAPDSSYIGAQLRRYINSTSSARTVEDARLADAQIQLMSERRQRNILSLDASGRVREYELLAEFEFRVHNGKGTEFLPPTELLLKRDLSFDDASTLAKGQEAELLYRDMQTEAVQQILRRVGAIERR